MLQNFFRILLLGDMLNEACNQLTSIPSTNDASFFKLALKRQVKVIALNYV